MKKYILALILALVFISPGAASSAAPSPGRPTEINKDDLRKCSRENASLTISYNAKEDTVKGAKEKFKQRMKEVEDIVKKQDLKTFEVLNENFNIYSQQNSYDGDFSVTYQVSGSTTYKIEPADAIEKISELLAENKIQFNVNINSSTNRRACNLPGSNIEYSE